MRLFALVCMDADCYEATGLVLVEADDIDAALKSAKRHNAKFGIEVPEPDTVPLLADDREIRIVRELPRDVLIPRQLIESPWKVLQRTAA